MQNILNISRSGKGPLLVLIHGVAGGISIWDPIMPALEQHFEVIRMDLLGYGHSPKPKINYTYNNHIEAIKATLDNQSITGPFDIVGLSMGSLLAMNYAIKYPKEVNKIIGIGALFYNNESQARSLMSTNIWVRYALGNRIKGDIITKTSWFLGLHSKFIRGLFATQLYTDKMAKESLMNPFAVFRSTIYGCILHDFMPDLIKKLVSKKILFIHGVQDSWSLVVNIREGIKNYSNIKLQELDGVSHNTVVISPKITSDLIIEFLSSK